MDTQFCLLVLVALGGSSYASSARMSLTNRMCWRSNPWWRSAAAPGCYDCPAILHLPGRVRRSFRSKRSMAHERFRAFCLARTDRIIGSSCKSGRMMPASDVGRTGFQVPRLELSLGQAGRVGGWVGGWGWVPEVQQGGERWEEREG